MVRALLLVVFLEELDLLHQLSYLLVLLVSNLPLDRLELIAHELLGSLHILEPVVRSQQLNLRVHPLIQLRQVLLRLSVLPDQFREQTLGLGSDIRSLFGEGVFSHWDSPLDMLMDLEIKVLQTLLEGSQRLLLADVLPGCFDGWDPPCVDTISEAVQHLAESYPCQRFAIKSLWNKRRHHFLSKLQHLLHKLWLQRV